MMDVDLNLYRLNREQVRTLKTLGARLYHDFKSGDTYLNRDYLQELDEHVKKALVIIIEAEATKDE